MPQPAGSNSKKSRSNDDDAGYDGKKERSSSSGASSGATATDAISLLKADHRQVETWFEEFEAARSGSKKQELAEKLCAALMAHTAIEEEIFYPAFLEATEEEGLHHEAIIEHEGVKKVIAEIERVGADDEYFEARVKVLSEMLKHHVGEEEKREGLFAKARNSEMDLGELGAKMAARRSELLGATHSALVNPPPGGLITKAFGVLLGQKGPTEDEATVRATKEREARGHITRQ